MSSKNLFSGLSKSFRKKTDSSKDIKEDSLKEPTPNSSPLITRKGSSVSSTGSDTIETTSPGTPEQKSLQRSESTVSKIWSRFSMRNSMSNLPQDGEEQKTEETVKKMRLKYEAIYEHPELEEIFYEFLKSEFNQIILDFIRDHDNINEFVSDEEHFEIGKKIYETYIAIKSPKELNLSGKLRKKIMDSLENSNQMKFEKWILPKKPKEFYGEVYDLMKAELGTENFPRFIVSQYWKDIASNYEGNNDVMIESKIYNFQDDAHKTSQIFNFNSRVLLSTRKRRPEEDGKSNEEIANNYLKKGIESFKNNDFQNAYDMFTLAIHVNENLKEAYFNRGVLNYNLKNFVESMKDMTVLLEFDDKLAKGYAVRGMCLKNLNYLEIAIIDLEKANIFEPLAKNYMILGICYDSLDNFEKAIKNYTEYLKLESGTQNSMSVLHNRGQLYLQTYQFKRALDDFNECLKLCSNEEWKKEIKLLRGKCKRKLGLIKPGEFDIEEFDFTDSYNEMITLYKKKKYQDSIEIANNLIKYTKEPNHKYYYVRGLINKSISNDKNAIKDFEESLKLNPNDLKSLKHLPGLYTNVKRLKDVKLSYDKLINLQPTAEYYFQRGLYFYEEEEDEDKALSDYLSCLKLDDKHYDANYQRGLIYLAQEEHEKAMNDFNFCLSQKSDDLEVLIDRALCYYYLDDENKAKDDLGKVLKQDPENERANNLLSQIEE
eukprot:gene4920-8508_t